MARPELQRFLRARRAALSPAQVGLAAGRRRRTPGLRREEVAALADLGVTWYTWLEQGRDISVSYEALGRIGRALQLSPTDLAYLFSLAGAPPPRSERAEIEVDPHQARVLASIAAPALMLDARFDVLATNALADELFRADATAPARTGPFRRNNAWRLFMDPAQRQLYVDWEEVARRTAGVVRAHQANRVDDQAFKALVAALRSASPDFVRMWNEARTSSLETIVTRMRHPRLGNLKVAFVRFLLPTDRDGFLSVLSPVDAATTKAFAQFARRARR